jgi:hypothetical protein
MPTRRIDDLPRDTRCRHPDHNVPSMLYLRPGIYEHECPGCGRKFTFRVDGPTLRINGDQHTPWPLPHPRHCLDASPR